MEICFAILQVAKTKFPVDITRDLMGNIDFILKLLVVPYEIYRMIFPKILMANPSGKFDFISTKVFDGIK